MKSDIAWSKRIRVLVGAAGIPSTIIAGVGDFFSPKGGWVLPLAAGLLAMALLLMMVVLGTTWFVRMTKGDEAFQDWWQGPRRAQLGVWVVAIFAATSLIFGYGSFQKRMSGGLLADNIEMIGIAQQQMGLLQAVERNTARAADATERLAEQAKRENSEDPRKELANMGNAFTSSGFWDAIRRDDLRAVRLYIDGGMVNDSFRTDGWLLNMRDHLEVAAIVAATGIKATESQCATGLMIPWEWGKIRGPENIQGGGDAWRTDFARGAKMYGAFCKGVISKAHMKERVMADSDCSGWVQKSPHCMTMVEGFGRFL